MGASESVGRVSLGCGSLAKLGGQKSWRGHNQVWSGGLGNARQVEDVLVALRACKPRACRLHRRRVAGHERSHLLGADQVNPGLEALCDPVII
jgi:hypothetical protein